MQGISCYYRRVRCAYKNNTAARALWAEFNVRYAKTKGIRCFWWDNGGDPSKTNNAIINRTDNTIPFPEIISGLIKGAI